MSFALRLLPSPTFLFDSVLQYREYGALVPETYYVWTLIPVPELMPEQSSMPKDLEMSSVELNIQQAPCATKGSHFGDPINSRCSIPTKITS
jgi:hypothetical protein